METVIIKAQLLRALYFCGILLLLTTCNGRKSGTDDQGPITKEQWESMSTAAFRDSLTSVQPGYLLDIDQNSAPYLVGRLYDMIDNPDGSKTFRPVMAFNYLSSPGNVSTELLDKSVDFTSYVNKGFKTDVNLDLVASKVKSEMEADDAARIKYETIYSAIGTGSYIDTEKIHSDNILYDFRQLHKPVIISSVIVKKLSYTKYKKLKGSLAGTLSIVNLNGNVYYQNDQEENYWQTYVFTTDYIMTASKTRADTAAISARASLQIEPKIIQEINRTGNLIRLNKKN